MAVSFKNSPLKVFLIALSGLFVASLAVGVFNGVYFSNKKEGAPLSNIKYGEKIAVKDLLKEQNISYLWLNSGHFTFEAKSQISETKSEIINDVVIYDKATNSITFDGVGKGSLWFVSSMDASVNFHVDFESSFNNKQLASIVNAQYPSLFKDKFLSKAEMSQVKKLTLDGFETFDGSDLGNFTSLESITFTGNKVTRITKNRVINSAKIYVQKEFYNEYMALEGYGAYQDRLFPDKANSDTYVVVLYKNGGTLFDSWDKDYDSYEVKKGEPFKDIPKLGDIRLPGSTFQGWYDASNKLYDDKTVITKDTKLYAKWSLDEYYVTYHVLDKTTNDYVDSRETYYYLNNLVLKDIGDEYNDSKRIFIGWSSYSDATTAEYEPNHTEEAYFDGLNADLELYAVFAWRTLHIRIYNGENVIMNKDCSYGNSFLLKYEGSEPVGFGKFAGYSLNQLGKSKDYDDNVSITVEYNYDNPNDITHIYRTTNQNNNLNFYCIFDPTDQFAIYYRVTNASEVEQEYTQGFCVDGDSSTGTLIPHRAITLRSPESFYQNAVNNIDKVGKHFIGWVKESAGVKFLYTNYDVDYGDGVVVKTNNYVIASGFDKCENVTLRPLYADNQLVVSYDTYMTTSRYKTQTLNYGDALTHQGTYTRPGYYFNSFTVFANNQSIKQIEKEATVSSETMKEIYTEAMKAYGYTRHEQAQSMDIKISPNWNIYYYTIYFNSMGGSQVSNQNVAYGSKVSKPSNPTRDKFDFQYWYLTDPDIEFDFKNYIVTTSIELHALWEKSCLAEGSLITMKDGSKKPVEDVQLGEEVLTWNFFTGSYEAQPVMYLKVNPIICDAYIMKFDNGQEITSIGSHAFYDYSLKQFVEVSKAHYQEYINDYFYFETGISRLMDITPIDYRGNCYVVMPIETGNCFANDLLNTIPEYISFSQLAPVDDDMKYDQNKLEENLATFGYANYSDYQDYVSEELFCAYGGVYLNVLFGLGNLDIDTLLVLANDFYVNGD